MKYKKASKQIKDNLTEGFGYFLRYQMWGQTQIRLRDEIRGKFWSQSRPTLVSYLLGQIAKQAFKGVKK